MSTRKSAPQGHLHPPPPPPRPREHPKQQQQPKPRPQGKLQNQLARQNNHLQSRLRGHKPVVAVGRLSTGVRLLFHPPRGPANQQSIMLSPMRMRTRRTRTRIWRTIKTIKTTTAKTTKIRFLHPHPPSVELPPPLPPDRDHQQGTRRLPLNRDKALDVHPLQSDGVSCLFFFFFFFFF